MHDPLPTHDFEDFAHTAEARLRRALIGSVGADRMPDAVAEALAFAWEHWDDVSTMSNPLGYLFRVGQSRTRPRKRPQLPLMEPKEIPGYEPQLPDLLMALPETQRTAVWLAHGCQWPHSEIAEMLGVSTSTVSTHVNRGLARLKSELGANDDAES